MGDWPAQERRLLQKLDRALKREPVPDRIDSAVLRLEAELTRNPGSLMAWEPLSLEPFGAELPGVIRSGWIFILQGGSSTGAERHPNSHQRTMSYRGEGDLQVRVGERWRSTPLASSFDAPLERRWTSIPPNVWHQAVVPDRHWVVVSFHTAAQDALVEERADPADARRMRKRRYVNRPPGRASHRG